MDETIKRTWGSSFWICDVLFNNDKTKRLAKIAKEYDFEVSGAIMFTLSPVHSDEYYARQVKELAASPDIDTILLYDTAGVWKKSVFPLCFLPSVPRLEANPLNFILITYWASQPAYLDSLELG